MKRMNWNYVTRLTACFVTSLLASTSYAQFGNQFGGGVFDNVLNQALPRMSAPVNGMSNNFNQSTSWPNQNNSAAYVANGSVGQSPTTTGWLNGGVNNTFNNGGSYSLNPNVASRDWKLGVTVDSLETGAIVRQVVLNSPAQRAGIEPNDIIIAINGIQVGYVENRLNDVGDQIRRSADASGRVRALVLDGRQSRLQMIPIDLDSASTGVTGSIALRDRGTLPYGSILTVQLENVTRPFYEVRNGKILTQIYGTGPFPFELQYDPQYIDPRDRYQLNATVTNQTGQMLYALRQPVPIPTGGLPPNTALALESIRDLQVANQQQGGVITASYGQDPNILNKTFQQLLGRLPNVTEQVAWGAYLNQGNSLADLQAKLLASPNYFERLGNNPQAFIQSMFRSLGGHEANQNEINAWLSRLQQYQGNREEVAREFIQQMR